MPKGLTRYYGAGDLHFITCSCYHRQPLLGSAKRRDLFLTVFEQVRRRYQFVVVGYVVMPEHFHLLISEPQDRTPSVVMQALKLGFARRVLGEQRRRRHREQADLFEHAPQHIWQPRYYDFNVYTALSTQVSNPARPGAPSVISGPTEPIPSILRAREIWATRHEPQPHDPPPPRFSITASIPPISERQHTPTLRCDPYH